MFNAANSIYPKTQSNASVLNFNINLKFAKTSEAYNLHTKRSKYTI